MTPNVAAVVLAAGGSTRLGRPKQLLDVDGQSLLSRTLDAVREASLEPRILVVGGYADDILARIDTTGFDIVHNPDYAEGQSTSLKTALAALPSDVDGAVILLGDQPLVPAGLIDQMASAFDPEADVAVLPRYADGPANPVLLSRSIFDELQQLDGDVGARDVLKQYLSQIREIDASDRPIPLDIDTYEDYLAFLQNWSSTGAPQTPRYCQQCGGRVEIIERHDRLRPVCPACGFTAFYDPKIAVAVIVEIDGGIVMQQRKIDPGAGKWTFPSGFVDRGEVVEEAAAREVQEEVGLVIEDLELVDVYSEPGQTVVLIVFQASANGQQPSVGNETEAVQLFPAEDLPELAFPRDARIVREWAARRDARNQ